MTSATESRQIWHTMPGWGIAADLTPPELIAGRKLRALRKYLLLGLAVIVVVCVGAYTLAVLQNRSQQHALASETERTAQLQHQALQYSDIVKIQGSITEVQTQVNQLMQGDVNTTTLLTAIQKALPGTASINSIDLTLSQAATAASTQSSGLDTSGDAVIGKATLTGVAYQYDQVSKFVDNLSTVPGIANLIPGSQSSEGNLVHWNLTFDITNKALSHEFDAQKNGGH